MPDPTAIVDAILAPTGRRPADILKGMSEVRTIAGFKFLTAAERKEEDPSSGAEKAFGPGSSAC
jgi:hypothetical protein